MSTIRDWRQSREMWVRVLEKQTSEGLDVWNERVRKETIADENALRDWLSTEGVTGYAQSLLVMERFGYPDFLLASADELIVRQYADRSRLRPIYDAVILAAERCGELIIQARKTYVSLVAPRRTFARVQPAKTRVDLGLRLEKCEPGGRLELSRIHHTMRVQIALTTPSEVDTEVQRWLQLAYLENS
ncbi:MAG TPA: DUF5655 domain-containing protein [Pyrinomonadaceae bacterium]|nr:DUF5655 domain-containing protein [Pyrinomonadaceae bacterium]